MNLKPVYAYIRISDKYKQGDGVSLSEQRRILTEYAKSNDLTIIHFYEERQTAAKKGRPIFKEMMQNLKSNKAEGVIIHKIDRSARNLHDWADIGDLIDQDIDVFFAHESLNMRERGGRLSADIQAVMASDYVRNLRQETIKGLYGRLKQGYYPWRAPVGYDDNGKGKNKTINPQQAVFVEQIFELYLSGQYNIRELSIEMEKRGLRNKSGGTVCKNGISAILQNPFYIGLMKVKGKTYQGNHKPIIDPRVFKQVQMKIKSRKKSKGFIHRYLFRKQIRCERCNYMMTGERQKGHVYYRCATKKCSTKSIREDLVERYVKNVLKTITLSNFELEALRKINMESKDDWFGIQQKREEIYRLELTKLENQEQKLIDLYLEDAIEKEKYNAQRERLLIKIQDLKSQMERLSKTKDKIFDDIEKFLELCKNPIKTYDSGIQEEKREMLEIITSNLTVDQRKVSFSMVSPYSELANRDFLEKCVPFPDTHRKLYGKIVYLDKNTGPVVPKPMNSSQIKAFYDFLCGCASTLSKINTAKDHHAIQTDHPRSQ
ncbi:MAG: recombinase family protein [Xanthomarina gelatinilytica]|uniref:recombinase family protein n=1 Tax=Xanthomarina gelatinilytica TaxID=1137281 RepID=UPI003A85F068